MEPAIKAGNLQAMRPCLKFGIFTCFKCKYHLLSCRTQRLSIDMFYLSNTDTYEGSRFSAWFQASDSNFHQMLGCSILPSAHGEACGRPPEIEDFFSEGPEWLKPFFS